MKVNFNVPLTRYNGETLKDNENKDVLAKHVVCNVLSLVTEATPNEKIRLDELMHQIYRSLAEMELSPEDTVTIRKYIAVLPVSTFVPLYKMLG